MATTTGNTLTFEMLSKDGLELLAGTKQLPRANGVKAFKTLFEKNEDGTISVYLPTRCPPDNRAYTENRAKQMERKTKMVAKLRKKLETA